MRLIDHRVSFSDCRGIRPCRRTGGRGDAKRKPRSTVVATIAEVHPLKVEVYLPTEAYPKVRVGMRAEIRPHEPIGGSHVAEVASKDAKIDAASGLFQIQLRLQNPENAIPAGLRCTVRFLGDGQVGAADR